MNLNPNSAMVVLSGGQDSTTCLGWALKNFATVSCVTFDYGQRHAIELAAARDVVAFFERMTNRVIDHEVVRIGHNAFAGMSPLTDPEAKLETYENHEQMEQVIGDRVEKTFVPMRNAVFLMLAANRAVVAGCANLITGVCQADNANYPDCRASFISQAKTAINYALGVEHVSNQVGVLTPLMHLSKAQSIELALGLDHTYEALKYSHTAYDGAYPPTGKDHASILRAHGFEQAHVPDPLVLRAYAEGRMALPTTLNYENARLFMDGFREPLVVKA